jgi:uncharacterized HhH-GPD family protein
VIYITGDPDVDGLLGSDGTALLIGMLLDQQVPMEWAFAGPARLRDRLGHLDAATIAGMQVDDVVETCARPPAVHRFPAAMGKRIHALCVVVAEQYGGDGARVWAGARTGDELVGRLRALPGFGEEKSQIFVALLGKRLGVRPPGWRAAAGVFGDRQPRTIADIDGPESLAEVRAWKQAQRAAGKDKQGRTVPPRTVSSPAVEVPMNRHHD